MGAGVTLLLGALAVATGGLLAVALAGAAIAACAVTVSVSVTDAKTGKGREDFGFQLITATAAGFVTGASIAVAWTALPSAATAIGIESSMLLGTSTFTAIAVPKIATFAGYSIMGASGLLAVNEAIETGSGRNLICDYVFGGDYQSYESFAFFIDGLLGGITDLGNNNRGLAGTDTSDEDNAITRPAKTVSDTDDNTLSPLTEAEQNYVNTKVNNILDNQDERVNRMLDKQDRDVIRIMDSIDEAQGTTGKHPNAATESVGGKAESGTPIDGKTTNTGNKTGNGGVVISNYSMEYESDSNANSKPYTNSRPSFRKGVVEEVWENAKGPDGLVRDPNTGEVIDWTPGESRKGVWDMGHIPEAKYSEMHEAYMNGELTTKEFVDWYNDPTNYRPELPCNNRSHKYE